MALACAWSARLPAHAPGCWLPRDTQGMPFKWYHGKTGIVWNVTKRAIGVEVNKRVRRSEQLAWARGPCAGEGTQQLPMPRGRQSSTACSHAEQGAAQANGVQCSRESWTSPSSMDAVMLATCGPSSPVALAHGAQPSRAAHMEAACGTSSGCCSDATPTLGSSRLFGHNSVSHASAQTCEEASVIRIEADATHG